MPAALRVFQQLRAQGLERQLTGVNPHVKLSRAVPGKTVVIPPLVSLHVLYTPYRVGAGGTSRKLSHWIVEHLPRLAAEHPTVAITVQPQYKGVPMLVGRYGNDFEKLYVVDNWDASKLSQAVKQLTESSGTYAPRQRHQTPVRSFKESITPLWSPFDPTNRFRA